MYVYDGERLTHRQLQARLNISFPKDKPPAPWEIYTPPPAPEPTLDDLKRRKRQQIDSDRYVAIDAGFEHNGMPVQTRTQDRENLQGLVTAAQLDSQAIFTFRDGDNVEHQLSAAEVIALGVAAMQHVQAQYVKSWALKDQIDNAESPEDLDLIQW